MPGTPAGATSSSETRVHLDPPGVGGPRAAPVIVDLDGLDVLIRVLAGEGRTVLGPTVRDGAIVIDELDGVDDLPAGWGDEQGPGSYRLVRRDDDARFGHVVGPHSWKAELFPPRTLLLGSTRSSDGFTVEVPDDRRPAAFVGVRPCDLRAIETQDLVFDHTDHPDPTYRSRRADAVVVAVQCTDPAATCFCTSMGAGPRSTSGFDLALTEILDGGHRFVIEIGSQVGRALMVQVPHVEASPHDLDAAEARSTEAAARIGRRVDTDGLPARLAATLEHPRWDDVAERCLTCANCTMVCPTCFCSAVEDRTDLTGDHAERWRRWDSCFTLDHSNVNGSSVRSSSGSRYRQWLTHKFGTWHDQFGVSGCTGCGRCIAWCPVGIDVTEELSALRSDPPAAGSGPQEVS
jgi:sulfhydrogenase subunit beta (sulfur reductase)